MLIKINPYLKRNGELMLFINNDRGVSIGDSGRIFTSKLTNGQNKLLDKLSDFFDAAEYVYEGQLDFDSHKEKKALCDIGHLFLTDTATVAGINVGSDGVYLYRKNRLYNLNQSVEVED